MYNVSFIIKPGDIGCYRNFRPSEYFVQNSWITASYPGLELIAVAVINSRTLVYDE